MRQSLRTRLVIIFTGVIVLTIIMIWCMNNFMLPGFYQKTKIAQMTTTYQSVENAIRGIDWDTISDEDSYKLYDTLEELGSKAGMSIYVIRVVKNDDQYGSQYIYPSMSTRQKQMINSQVLVYLQSQITGAELPDNYKVVSSQGDYNVYKIYDDKMGSDFMELINNVNQGTWVYMRANFQRVEESAGVSNQFLAYVGIAATLCGIAIMLFISNWFTRPILRLAKNAQKMSGLDFSVRYEGNRVDEIGILGNSMNKMSDELERTISELKTANNELQSDIERKQEQDEMRTEFIANVSHELKTPIALIQGYAEGLQDNINDDEESRQFYCEVIVDEAQKMNKMVKSLLSLNQLEFGNSQIHIERCNIEEMIRSVVDKVKLVAEQKEVAIQVVCEAPLYAWADEYMIDEVITNYINNALNHVDGEKRIEIKAIPDGNVVRVCVFNTGKTIPEEDINRIWEKFYKIDKARTREYGGNGIGLSIVKAVMEAHNQKYGVKNYENGVEFWFELDMKNVD